MSYDDDDIPVALALYDVSTTLPVARLGAQGAALLRRRMSNENNGNEGNEVVMAKALPSFSSIRFDLPVSREMFEMYDRAGEWLTCFGNVEGSVAALNFKIKAAEEGLERNDTILQKIAMDEAVLGKRIDRNEHPHFLHYLQFNRKGKVNRLKGEMEVMRRYESEIRGNSEKLKGDIAKFKLDRTSLMMKDEFERGRKRIFERAVASAPIAPRVIQIREVLSRKYRELADGERAEQQVEDGLAVLRSKKQLKKASKIVNSDDFKLKKHGGKKHTTFQKQIKKIKSLLNLIEANFTRARNSLSDEIKARYQADCSQISGIEFPALPQSSAADDFKRVVEEATRVVSETMRLFQSLQRKIKAANLPIQNEIQELTQQEREALNARTGRDRDAIFLSVRQQYYS